MTPLLIALISGASVAAAPAPAPSLKPELAGVAFLVGDWSSGVGKVAETGGASRGSSRITAEAGGAVLLRRDHTDLSDAAGKPAGSFEQIMMIYPEGGTLHADYSDGDHIIHYTAAQVQPGKAVVFTSGGQAGAPVFRLGYTVSGDTLAVAFAMQPPGASEFRPIATGTLQRSLTPSRTAR